MAGGETPPTAQPAAAGAGGEDTHMHHRVELDAMGHDKRRAVVGRSYGPSLRQQATVYGTFIIVMAVLVIGFLLVAKELDKAPETNPDLAPWSASDAPQRPPGDIDDSAP